MTEIESSTDNFSESREPTEETLGGIPSIIDIEWVQFAHDLIRKSPDEIRKSAEKIITLNTSIIAFSSIFFKYFEIVGNSAINPCLLMGYGMSVLLLFISIICCFFALDVKIHNISLDSPTEIQKFVENLSREKLVHYNRGKFFFLVGLGIFWLSLIFANFKFNT